MLSKKVALKKEIILTKKAKTVPMAKEAEVKETLKENEITEEVKQPKVLIKPRRIQTAEGWKRSMLLTKKKVK